MHRVARGTCVNAVDVLVAPVDPNTGSSTSPCDNTQILLGCADPSANNFNPLANTDDGSCTFDIPGCTDSLATNFDPNADLDDSSCIYPNPGCTDPIGLNYNVNADIDDGSCTYMDPLQGCMDSTADNYNSLAEVSDDSCTYDDAEIEAIDEIDSETDDIKTAGLGGDNKMLMYIAIGIGVILLLKK